VSLDHDPQQCPGCSRIESRRLVGQLNGDPVFARFAPLRPLRA